MRANKKFHKIWIVVANYTEFNAMCQKYGLLSARNFLPGILQTMPENPKCDQFHYIKMVPKLENQQTRTINL